MKLSVRLWQTSLFVAVIMVATLVLAFALFSSLNRSITSVSRDQLSRDSAELAGVVAPYFPVQGDPKKRERVRMQVDRFIMTYAYTYDAWVYDADGGLVFSRHQSTPFSADLLASAQGALVAPPAGSDIPFMKVVLGKSGLAIAAHVIRDTAGNRVGGVILAARTTDAAQILLSAQDQLELAFFVAVLAAGLLGLLFSEVITRQVRRMSRAASAIADGDFSQRLKRGPVPDEISDLAVSFNRMAEELGKAFAAIKGQEREIAAVVESMGEGVIAVDPSRVIRLANPVAARLLGTQGEALVGRRIEEAIEGEELLGPIDQALVGRHVTETVHLGNRVLLLQGTPFTTGDEEGGAVLLVRDVTEQKRLEQAQRDFTQNASHEMRTPIAALKGLVELLDAGAKERPQVRDRFLKTMQNEIERLQRLVSDLFALAQLDSGRSRLEMRPHSAAEIASDVAALMTPLAEEADLRLVLDVAPDAGTVMCDRDRILQVLMGFADNAIRNTPAPGRITVWVSPHHGGVYLGVRDTGPGVPEADQDRIFDRFYSAKAKQDVHRGTGLGLSIAREIVESHGSRIVVESPEGAGADFYFSLEAPPPQLARRHVGAAASEGEGDGGGEAEGEGEGERLTRHAP